MAPQTDAPHDGGLHEGNRGAVSFLSEDLLAPLMKKTLSIGGVTYDLFVRTGRDLVHRDGTQEFVLPLGEKIRVQEVIEAPGGGACNTSVGLSRLGCSAAFAGVLGSDQWGERLLGRLQKEGVSTDSVTIVQGETSGFSLILSVSTGERVILYSAGTNAHLQDPTFDKSAAAKTDWIYLNHINESTTQILDDVVEILEQKERPGLTWNPGGSQIKRGCSDPLLAKLLKHTDLLLLNKDEAIMFTQEKDPHDALRTLIKCGATIVCITDGKNGSVASDGKKIYTCPILKTEVRDMTGAGDAFGSAATWALLEGFPLPMALRAGTINSSGVVGQIGAQAGLLADTEMHNKLKNTHLTVEETTL